MTLHIYKNMVKLHHPTYTCHMLLLIIKSCLSPHLSQTLDSSDQWKTQKGILLSNKQAICKVKMFNWKAPPHKVRYSKTWKESCESGVRDSGLKRTLEKWAAMTDCKTEGRESRVEAGRGVAGPAIRLPQSSQVGLGGAEMRVDRENGKRVKRTLPAR